MGGELQRFVEPAPRSYQPAKFGHGRGVGVGVGVAVAVSVGVRAVGRVGPESSQPITATASPTAMAVTRLIELSHVFYGRRGESV